MLTLKVITEETDRVIRGLEKKHFQDAKACIDKVIELDSKRRSKNNALYFYDSQKKNYVIGRGGGAYREAG